jgi:hypothetical protein
MKNKYTWMWNVIVVLVVVVSAASCVVSAFGNEPHGIPPGGIFHSHPNEFSNIPAGSSKEYMDSANTTMPDDTLLSLEITPRKVIKGETVIHAALSSASFTDNYNDYGIDTDGDGLYDYLVIEAEITVTKGGVYEFWDELYYYNESTGCWDYGVACPKHNYSYLDPGLHNLTLKLNGIEIHALKYRGTFKIGLYLAGELNDEWTLIDEVEYYTGFYDYTGFQRPPAEFAPGFNDYGRDTDGNSLYDYLVIEKAITVRKAGNYRLSGRLESPSGERIDYDDNNTYLEAGMQSIKLQFYGLDIYNAGENGSFVVDMYLYDTDDGRRLDSTTNTTAYYNYTEFERPPAEFAPGFNDYGLDTDGDSLFDYLVIEKAITVRKAGNYKLYGSLESPSGEERDYDDNNTYLEEGLQSITLQFYGPSIYNTEESGNFVVYMDLYETEDWIALDSTTNTTAYYRYTEFQRPPAEFAPDFNDYGLDTDGNSLYDYVVIEKAITVRKAGNYELYGRLESPSGERIDYDYNNTYLEEGMQSITLQFYGPSIYNTEESGNFVVYMDLYETEDWIELDSTTNKTAYYRYTEFERPPAEFTGNFDDCGLDTDGDGLYNYIAIGAEMNVKKAGEYVFYCSLMTSSGDWIDSDGNRTYLDVGIHSITSMLSGHRIYDPGYTGSFRAVFELYEAEEWVEIDEAEYPTADYHYTDFDPVIPPTIVGVTAAPNVNISKDNPAMINATISGDYLSGMILFAGEKVESTETTTIYELRSYEWIPSDEWLFVGSNTYTISAQWNATAIGTYVEEIYFGCYHAADGANESYPLIWELPAGYIWNEFNRTIYYAVLSSFFHNGIWYDDAEIFYFPDTAKVELVYISHDMVFLNTMDPKLIEEYPNAKSLNPDSQCKFMNFLIVTDTNGTIIADPFGDAETRESEEFRIGALIIKKNTPLPAGEYVIGVNVEDEAGNRDIKGTTAFTAAGTAMIFDTGPGTYPGISGTHNGTIIPAYDLNVSMVYTYPCSGTGGHTESIELYENGERIAYGTWNGYAGDWHNVTMQNARGAPYVVLSAGHEYDYVIRTGSYPQIIHKQIHHTPDGGVITCDAFIDVNGKRYNDWIPAITFF